MAKGCNNYEEARKLRLEENKKRFEDLGISKISKKLTKIKSPAKKSPSRFLKPKSKTNGVVEPRRSSRARNSVSSYREEFSMDLPHRSSYIRKRSRSSSSSWESYIARPLEEIKEATREERIRALEAAEKLQNNLQSSNPSFVKSMVRSHVYSCFWLGLPSRFCEEHLPKTVYNMVLEDEDGSETDAVYIGNRSGLSGGWRGFALHHKLDDGDALVFELVEPARFKIYIVRAFPKSDEEEEENDTLVEEENVHKSKATKESKGSGNRQSESKKTKRQKQAIVCETKESESSKESMPESSINKDSKPKRVNPKRRTKSFQKNVQKKSKLPTTPDSESIEEAKVETLKLETTIRKTRSSQKKMQKISEVPTTPDSEPKEEAKIESLKPKAAIAKSRSSQRKMEKMSEVPTTPDSQPKEEAKIESLKPKAAIAKTRSSQRKMEKISEVPTTPDSQPKEEAKIESLKPKAAIAKTRSSQRKMQKISEVPTTSDSKPKEEAKIETLKPKAAIAKTRSSQRKRQKISEVPTTPDNEPKEEAKIETPKPNAAIAKTRSSQRKMQKTSEVPTTSKGEALVETMKPKAATKLSKKKKKSEEGNACEIGDSGNTKQLLEDNVVKIIEVNPSEKKEVIEDADIELKKVERDEKASKCDSQKPRKKPTQRFFRKRA